MAPLPVHIDSKDRPQSLTTIFMPSLSLKKVFFWIDRTLSTVYFGPESKKFEKQKFSEQKDNIECTPRYLLEDSCPTFVLTLSLCNDYDKGGSHDHHMISDLVLRSELIFTFDIFSEWL